MRKSSTNDFYNKLCEKDKKRAEELYRQKMARGSLTSANKQNMNIQKEPRMQSSTQTKRNSKSSQIQMPTMSHSKIKQKQHNYLEIDRIIGDQLIKDNKLYANHSVYQFQEIFISGSKPSTKLDPKIRESRPNSFKQELNKKVTQAEFFSQEHQTKKCIVIAINFLSDEPITNFSSLVLPYAEYMLQYGKAMWSMLAIQQNKRYDLFSMKLEPIALWKGKGAPLIKTPIAKDKILSKLLQFAGERQKCLGNHQAIIKIQFANKSSIYLILRQLQKAEVNPLNSPSSGCPTNTQLLVSQEIFFQSLTKHYHLNLLHVNLVQESSLPRLYKSLEYLQVHRVNEKEFNKKQTENYLMGMIQKLNGELKERKSELSSYKTKQIQEEDEQFIIPSERAEIGIQKYNQLTRQLRDDVSMLNSTNRRSFA